MTDRHGGVMRERRIRINKSAGRAPDSRATTVAGKPASQRGKGASRRVAVPVARNTSRQILDSQRHRASISLSRQPCGPGQSALKRHATGCQIHLSISLPSGQIPVAFRSNSACIHRAVTLQLGCDYVSTEPVNKSSIAPELVWLARWARARRTNRTITVYVTPRIDTSVLTHRYRTQGVVSALDQKGLSTGRLYSSTRSNQVPIATMETAT